MTSAPRALRMRIAPASADVPVGPQTQDAANLFGRGPTRASLPREALGGLRARIAPGSADVPVGPSEANPGPPTPIGKVRTRNSPGA